MVIDAILGSQMLNVQNKNSSYFVEWCGPLMAPSSSLDRVLSLFVRSCQSRVLPVISLLALPGPPPKLLRLRIPNNIKVGRPVSSSPSCGPLLGPVLERSSSLH